ncbi:MAG: site-specific DNA-methyltransferase [Candidatus Aenigmarchaeota archaeon]|nr:site-specific DNA-methyltransferase [Candidatus Aenigmarchaeota archaeon]
MKEKFPQVFEDEKVNFEKLKALLTGDIIEKEDDRFYFNWAGKSKLFKIIQEPGYGTLKPDRERSIDFDNTENIVIVGENLETLKLLLKPYFGKVKMIYIDPPYNTGKDFIYKDNFKEPLKDYLEKTGQIDNAGSKLTTNTEASGRYHSDWLNFMYPRLFLARNLLREDGLIFVSIDDHEVHNLRKIMDEIFGEENLLAQLVWNLGTGTQAGHFTRSHEYIVTYARNKNNLPYFQSIDTTPVRHGALKRISKANPASEITFPAGIEFEGNNAVFEGELGGNEKEIIVSDKMIFENGRLKEPVTLKAGWAMRDQILSWLEGKETYDSKGQKVLRFYFNKEGILWYEKERGTIHPKTVLIDVAKTKDGTTEIENIFSNRVMTFPKPTKLIKYLVKIVTRDNDIILDFFAGSGTTGHAVWEMNNDDGGNRKFILINLDEPVDPNTEAGKNAIKLRLNTVADICIERLKRISEKYQKEEHQKLIKSNQDFGFKVFKLDKSNFNLKDEFEISEGENIEELKKKYLDWLGIWVNEPLVGDWKPIDIVYEVMLKEGLDLNSKIEEIKIMDNNFYHVVDEKQGLEFYISLDESVDENTIEEIRTSKYRDKMFVFLDKALSDNAKLNLKTFVRLKVI